jgi:hypothetical protein
MCAEQQSAYEVQVSRGRCRRADPAGCLDTTPRDEVAAFPTLPPAELPTESSRVPSAIEVICLEVGKQGERM